ncbi:MAG: heparan-alpha-glucosaminide N-acetyltransferase [Rhodoferax sp.]
MNNQRLDALDALRGLAMLWMTVFHFCFDLNHFGYIRQNFYTDPVWTWQRSLIVSLFLLCAGLGQAVAVAQGQSWRRFWQRWAQVAGGALLVTLGSWLMYPKSFIYFGVLHGLALMLLLARLSVSWGRWLWLLGGLAIASKFIASYAIGIWATSHFVAILNAPALNWLGWMTRPPVTEDHVPLFPWLGVMWWGVAIGNGWLSGSTGWLHRRLPAALQPLARLGRWSLSYYLLHQPMLIAALLLLGWMVKSSGVFGGV